MEQAFAVAASRFRDWVLRGSDIGRDAVRAGVSHMAELYSAGLNLPLADLASLDPSGIATHKPTTQELRKRLGERMPFQYYWEALSPLSVGCDPDVGAGDILDDIIDVYNDVNQGLTLYEARRSDEALAQWSFSFHSHWALHVTSAIRALQSYLSDPDAVNRTTKKKSDTA